VLNPSSIFTYYPLKLGDFVFVGADAVVEAASIGSHVHVGAGSVIQKSAIVGDYVRILDGSVVPEAMVVPSFSVVAGRPAQVVAEVPEGEMGAFEDIRALWAEI
jgi:dynactin-5